METQYPSMIVMIALSVLKETTRMERFGVIINTSRRKINDSLWRTKKMSKKRELLKKELYHAEREHHKMPDTWWKNMVLLMAEILVEEEQR